MLQMADSGDTDSELGYQNDSLPQSMRPDEEHTEILIVRDNRNPPQQPSRFQTADLSSQYNRPIGDEVPTPTSHHNPATDDDHDQPAVEDDHQPAVDDDHQPAVDDDHQPAVDDDHQPAVDDDHQPAVNDGAGLNAECQTNASREKLTKKEKKYKWLMIVGFIILCVILIATVALVICTIILFTTKWFEILHKDRFTLQATSVEYATNPEYRIHLDRTGVNRYKKGEVSLTTDMPATLAVSEKHVRIISKTYEDANISFTDDTYILPVQFYSHGNVSFEANVMGESDGIIGASLSRYDLFGINHVVKRENRVFTKGQSIFFRNYSSNDPGYYSLTMYTLTINGSKIEGTIETRNITYNILDPNQTFENNCTIDNKVETSCSLSIRTSISDIESNGIVLIFEKYAGKSYQVKVSGTTGNKLKVISFPVAFVVSVIGLLSMIICVTCTCKERVHLKKQVPQPKTSQMETEENNSEETPIASLVISN